MSYPEIQPNPFQVAKNLGLDRGEAILITLDTRFEFWGGLCHGCGPIQQSIFELDGSGVWVEANSRHRQLVEEWIREDIKRLQEAKAEGREDEIGTAALNLYLDAESAGQIDRYRHVARRALKDIGWTLYLEKLDLAHRRKFSLVDLEGEYAFSPGSGRSSRICK